MSKKQRQHGFSLMELLIALMIIGVIATLGIRALTGNTDKARYIKATDNLRMMSQGLDQYYLANNGKYPDLGSWEAMVEPNSPLVKKNLIPANMAPKDPWDQPYEAKSGKGTYELKCAGDPNNQAERPAIIWEPGRVVGGPTGQAPAEGGGGDKGAAPAGEAKK
jgi:general secretion pathway protein G